MKQLSGHLGLKALSYCFVTPFFSAALIESVQSDIASERPGVFDCVREGSFRLLGYGMPQSTRLFPVWHLILPTAFHGTLHYVIAAITQVSPLKVVVVVDCQGAYSTGSPQLFRFYHDQS